MIDKEFRLFLPKKYNGKRINKKDFDDILRRISNRFGGSTVFNSIGVWKDDKGKLIKEPVWVITADRDVSKIIEDDIKFMSDMGVELGKRFNQDVMFETRDNIEVKQILTKKNLKGVI